MSRPRAICGLRSRRLSSIASLAAHLKAKAEIEIGVAKEVLLHRLGVARSTTYDRENLAQLDRAIAAIRRAIAFEDR